MEKIDFNAIESLLTSVIGQRITHIYRYPYLGGEDGYGMYMCDFIDIYFENGSGLRFMASDAWQGMSTLCVYDCSEINIKYNNQFLFEKFSNLQLLKFKIIEFKTLVKYGQSYSSFRTKYSYYTIFSIILNLQDNININICSIEFELNFKDKSQHWFTYKDIGLTMSPDCISLITDDELFRSLGFDQPMTGECFVLDT